MRILIVGYGRVGRRTARVLKEEGHEVIVIESDPTKVERARDAGFMVHHGDVTRDEVIGRVDLATIDAVGAMTGEMNVNFSVCTVANAVGCRTVARIDDDYNADLYERYAAEVDEVIYPERLGAAGAKTALLGGDFNVVAELTEHLQILTVTVRDGSQAVGKRVHEVEMPEGVRIYAHGSADDPMQIPLPQTTIEPGDRLAILAEHDRIGEINDYLVGND